MSKRPTSVTVIAWILLVSSGLFLLASTLTINDPQSQDLMAKTPLPIPLQYAMLYLGMAISILSAVFMLRGANWARLLYIGWTGAQLLVLLSTSPVKAMLIPAILMYAVFAFFLLRPKASVYFTHSGND